MTKELASMVEAYKELIINFANCDYYSIIPPVDFQMYLLKTSLASLTGSASVSTGFNFSESSKKDNIAIASMFQQAVELTLEETFILELVYLKNIVSDTRLAAKVKLLLRALQS